MREEAKRRREVEKRKAAELAALEREGRAKEATIRALKIRDAAKEAQLRKKTEDLANAKKRATQAAASARRGKVTSDHSSPSS